MMYGSTPFAASPYATLTIPTQVTASGVQAAFATGTVQVKAAQRLAVTGVQINALMGLAQVKIRARIEVSGVSAQFFTNGTLVWYDIALPTEGQWEDIFENEFDQRTVGAYGAACYAGVAYSGDALEQITYEIPEDAWSPVDTTQSSAWRDIVL